MHIHGLKKVFTANNTEGFFCFRKLCGLDRIPRIGCGDGDPTRFEGKLSAKWIQLCSALGGRKEAAAAAVAAANMWKHGLGNQHVTRPQYVK
ncbi:hypothetical protein QIS74_04433 [Colletotrichum tabaci]|uniref:Uncharacterized protein n=1 Tax=Colletotrichum tabaci TaxID=1209068 RepID=A0AAV9TIJ2_9PEZI